MSKGSRIKENNKFFGAFVFYECFIVSDTNPKSVEVRKTMKFLDTCLNYPTRIVGLSYECRKPV
jgi:hypothetical protein